MGLSCSLQLVNHFLISRNNFGSYLFFMQIQYNFGISKLYFFENFEISKKYNYL